MFKCDLISLEKSLSELDIPKYSTIIIHSILFKFGLIEGGTNTIYNLFRRLFDETYTLVMPTFTFSFSNSRKWNSNNTKSETGILTEFMRKLENSSRSINPFHSVCIEGPNKDFLLDSISDSSFGVNSVFEKLYKLNAYNLSFGSEFVGGATFCHYVEELLQVPYRFYKYFPGYIVDNNEVKVEIDFKMYVRIIEKDYFYNNEWEIFWQDALKNNLVNYFKFNKKAPIFLMNIRDMHDFLAEKINKNPYYIAKKVNIK